MSTDPRAAAVTTALDKLAAEGDAGQIAARLTAAGHVGELNMTYTCPVARYLHHHTGAWVRVEALDWALDTRHGAYLGDLPGEIPEFIAAFDDRDYPELVQQR